MYLLDPREVAHMNFILDAMFRQLDIEQVEVLNWRTEFKVFADTWHSFLQRLEHRMLLYPDMSRSGYDAKEFVFASPCSYAQWDRALRRATKDVGYLPWLEIEEEGESIVIICRSPEHTDDDCLTTAAWLRIVNNFRGMIYALPYDDKPLDYSIGAVLARTSGVDPKQVRHVEV